MAKAQSALEFLVTYGWVALAVLIVLGALIYFGLISPNSFLPERCDFGDQLVCDEFVLTDTQLKIMFANDFQRNISVTSVDTLGSVSLTGCVLPVFILAYEKAELVCDHNLESATRPKMSIIITYNRGDAGVHPDHQLSGIIVGSVP